MAIALSKRSAWHITCQLVRSTLGRNTATLHYAPDKFPSVCILMLTVNGTLDSGRRACLTKEKNISIT